MTIQDAARIAIECQDGCNISGLVFSFAEVMHAICDEQHRLGQSTEWKNTHPIVTLFLSKLADMNRNQDFSQAYDACKALARIQPASHSCPHPAGWGR